MIVPSAQFSEEPENIHLELHMDDSKQLRLNLTKNANVDASAPVVLGLDGDTLQPWSGLGAEVIDHWSHITETVDRP